VTGDKTVIECCNFLDIHIVAPFSRQADDSQSKKKFFRLAASSIAASVQLLQATDVQAKKHGNRPSPRHGECNPGTLAISHRLPLSPRRVREALRNLPFTNVYNRFPSN
jgi:hypothetical protein